MITEEQIDWERLKNPHPLFKVFRMDEKNPIEFWKKVVELQRMLHNKYLYVGDEFRNKETIQKLVENVLFKSFSIFYELGDFQGLLGFIHIYPEFKCGLFFKIWDKKLFTKDFVRASQNVLDLYMDTFNLKRIDLVTPDERMVKLGKMAGFKVEGERPYAFKWKNKFYSNHVLGRVREE